VIILLLWLFITGIIIITGAQINAIIHKNDLEKQNKTQTNSAQAGGTG